MDIFAVVRVRGRRKRSAEIQETLKRLNLHRSNHCVLVKPTPSVLGMLKKVEAFITYGPVDDATLKLLLQKRAERGKEKAVIEDLDSAVAKMKEDPKSATKELNISPVFRLRPPRKGWKGIKRHYPMGALGKRPEMNSLLRRMI